MFDRVTSLCLGFCSSWSGAKWGNKSKSLSSCLDWVMPTVVVFAGVLYQCGVLTTALQPLFLLFPVQSSLWQAPDHCQWVTDLGGLCVHMILSRVQPEYQHCCSGAKTWSKMQFRWLDQMFPICGVETASMWSQSMHCWSEEIQCSSHPLVERNGCLLVFTLRMIVLHQVSAGWGGGGGAGESVCVEREYVCVYVDREREGMSCACVCSRLVADMHYCIASLFVLSAKLMYQMEISWWNVRSVVLFTIR